MPGTLALDIETVSPEREPTRQAHFRDSSYFQLLAVGLGYRSAPGDSVETAVLFREDDTPEAELGLVDAVCEWCEARPADTLLTYNGSGFDLVHLPGRVELAGRELGEKAEETDEADAVRRRLDSLFAVDHVDLLDEVREAWGGRRRLEWVCDELGVDVESTRWAEYDHGLDPDTWRRASDRGDPAVLNTDVPAFGERYLDLASVDARHTLTFCALADLLEAYTAADIEPLFELDDRRPFSP